MNLLDAINQAADAWGLKCLRCEIRDISLPDRVVEDMQMQVSAERKKRAQILESEGYKRAEINKAEGSKQAAILSSEGLRREKVNLAEGEAEALMQLATAQAKALTMIGGAIAGAHGADAAQYNVANAYVEAFGKLAKESNTLMLPANAGDPASMVAQAMSIYKQQGSGGA